MSVTSSSLLAEKQFTASFLFKTNAAIMNPEAITADLEVVQTWNPSSCVISGSCLWAISCSCKTAELHCLVTTQLLWIIQEINKLSCSANHISVLWSLWDLQNVIEYSTKEKQFCHRLLWIKLSDHDLRISTLRISQIRHPHWHYLLTWTISTSLLALRFCCCCCAFCFLKNFLNTFSFSERFSCPGTEDTYLCTT